MSRSIHRIFVFLILIAAGRLVYGQNAQIQGQVLDPSGAGIAKVLIRVHDQQTGSERKTETNDGGQYIVPGLNPGLYVLYAQADGFSTAVSNVITLNVAQNAVLDFKLQVGSTSAQVTVDAGTIEINTTDASVSTVIDRQFAENLPMNGRTFQSLIFLTPGVTQAGAGEAAGWADGQFSVNGQRTASNYWMVDGVGANIGITGWYLPGNGASGGLGSFNVLGGTNSLVSVDAMQEFRIETSTYAPEFGRMPGGQISIVTRSGTNHFHGTLFDYFRNTDLDATDWFAEHNGLPKAAEHQNDFGGVLGGPVIKDRTFFFFSYEGLRLRLPETLLTTVPDLAARESAIPAVQPFINAYPLPAPGAPDIPGEPGLAPFNASFSNPASIDAFSLRLDHRVKQNLSVFARYNYSPSNLNQRAAFGSAANIIYLLPSNTQTATAGGTWTISPKMVNETRFNYSSTRGSLIYKMDNFGGGSVMPAEILLPSPFTYSNAEAYVTPNVGTNMGLQNGKDSRNVQHQYNVVDTLSVETGKHSLKFGVDFRRLSPFFNPPQYTSSASFTTLAGLQNGISSSLSVEHSPDATFLFRNLGLFAQDTWRISPRLSVTYGLRWDIDFTPKTESGPSIPAVTGFSLTDLSNLALAPPGTPIYGTRYGGIAPRVGGAYRVSESSSRGSALRAGFGMFYDLASTEVGNLDIYSYPFSNNVPSYNVPFPTPLALAPLPPITPPTATQGLLFGFDPQLNLPYALEWNVSFEQLLGPSQTITASYIGSSGRRLLATESVANPNPNYLSVDLVANAGNSNYNALQLQFQRRLSRGLQALVSYSWSHSIDTGSYGEYTNGGFADLNANRGNSDFDIRNTLSIAMTYDPPAVRKNPVVDEIINGWSTENMIQAHSAPPVDIVDGAFTTLTEANSSILVRPDLVPGQPLYLYGSQYPGRKALNPDAFTNPPLTPAGCVPGVDDPCDPSRQGDLARNSLRAFGLAQWDFAVHRDFLIREGAKMQFRAEMFNVLNHPNFGGYNTKFGTGDPYFGQSTSMLNQATSGEVPGIGGLSGQYQFGGPRSVQLALKFMF